MKEIKDKLEKYLETELRPKFEIDEEFEERFKEECKQDVVTIVTKVFEVLINKRKIPHYISLPQDFVTKELAQYLFPNGTNKIARMLKNYTPEVFKIFETDLLDAIQDIKLQNSNQFVCKMLEHIHAQIIKDYKYHKEFIVDSKAFKMVKAYKEFISDSISLINDENAEMFQYVYHSQVLKIHVDMFIDELRECVGKDDTAILRNQTRYIYFFIKENILTKF